MKNKIWVRVISVTAGPYGRLFWLLSPTYLRKPPSRWTIARSCTIGHAHSKPAGARARARERAYTHAVTTFLNADRDVDLSGAKTADAVSSRHWLLPFDNRERASLSPYLNSECGETRRWREQEENEKKERSYSIMTKCYKMFGIQNIIICSFL